ncbi:MAG: tetratricopeptide repeat protein [Planctomycetes bacterium]|nr:tetratricopeptide repeat protein [Planctomycetota bacterium]
MASMVSRGRAWRALAASPFDRSALEHKGTLHATAGEWEEAAAAYQKAVDVKASANGYTMVAAVLVERGKLVDAQEAIARAIELEPEHGGAWVVRGDLMVRAGRLDDAVRAYEEAARVDPYRYAGMAKDRVTVVQRSRSGAP